MERWKRYSERLKDSRAVSNILIMMAIPVLGLLLCYNVEKLNEAREQKTMMEQEVMYYSQEAQLINNTPCRAVTVSQLSQVMEDMKKLSENYGLQMEHITKPVYQDGTGEVYELRFKGSWPRVAGFLEHLRPRDALVKSRMLEMQGTDGEVSTVMQMKVYTK